MNTQQIEELRYTANKLRETAEILDNRVLGYKDEGSILWILMVEVINSAAAIAVLIDALKAEQK